MEGWLVKHTYKNSRLCDFRDFNIFTALDLIITQIYDSISDQLHANKLAN